MNFRDDYLSQCLGSVHTLLANFQQANKPHELKKQISMHKENEDYIHVTLKEDKIDLSKTLSEKVVDHNNPFFTARESNVIKLRRLDKFQLDEYGNRKPTNLTEFLFGDQTTDYVLNRDHNLKCYVEYKEIVRVFSKILKPL